MTELYYPCNNKNDPDEKLYIKAYVLRKIEYVGDVYRKTWDIKDQYHYFDIGSFNPKNRDTLSFSTYEEAELKNKELRGLLEAYNKVRND